MNHEPSSASDLLGFPPVLDACCGSRMMWFNKHDDRCLFADSRRATYKRKPWKSHPEGSVICVDPDILADFTKLPFEESTFCLVVLDPPHVVRGGDVSSHTKGWLAHTYGWLSGEWREMLRDGFAECFRVLRPGGTLIFKWCETQIPLREILELTPEKPLFGHVSGAKARTHWVTFVKPNTDSATNSRISPP